jgi:hypothetical protein
VDSAESHYFCADCENECDGMPSGARKGDGRPLCKPCATRGALEGTADVTPWSSSESIPAVEEEDEPPPPMSSTGDGCLGAILFVAVALVVAIAMVWCRR